MHFPQPQQPLTQELQIFYRSLIGRSIFFLGLLAVTVVMYVNLPKNGDIWWSDAAHHALNGAFVLDFFNQLPLHHPIEFAFDYYRQWPALTILFYPPLFYALLAGVYAVLGVSEASALLVEFAFLFSLAWGAFRLSCHWLNRPSAFAVALLLVGAPEVAFWGQQIMLDVPAYAFLVWSADCLVRYLHSGSKGALYASVICVIAAIFTKYNSAFFIIVLAIPVVYLHGWQVFRNKGVLRAMLLGGISLLPIVAIFFTFAGYDLEQAAWRPGGPARWSVEGLTYYARVMPSVLSWPTIILALLYILALPLRPELRLRRSDAVFLFAWVMIGFTFYTIIALKETRHVLFITYPFTLAAILFLDWLLSRIKFHSAIISVAASGLLIHTLTTGTVPFLTGPRWAAQMVAQAAPPDTNVGFWGESDGTFIYAMRAYSERPDLGVVRIDKLLFRNRKIFFGHGETEIVMQPIQISDMLAKLHIQYVVMETHSHDEMLAVRMLEAALRSDKFTEIERIPMYANFHGMDWIDPTSANRKDEQAIIRELIVYRLNEEVPRGRIAPPMEIKLLGISL